MLRRCVVCCWFLASVSGCASGLAVDVPRITVSGAVDGLLDLGCGVATERSRCAVTFVNTGAAPASGVSIGVSPPDLFQLSTDTLDFGVIPAAESTRVVQLFIETPPEYGVYEGRLDLSYAGTRDEVVLSVNAVSDDDLCSRCGD
jgi:hypothetical protein